MKKLVGISTFTLQSLYGDFKALEIAKAIGADAVDFSLDTYSVLNKNSIYSKSEEEIVAHFTAVKKKADELGLIISQTHGRLRIYFADPAKDDAVFKDARIDCMVTKILGAPYTVMHAIATSITGPDAESGFMHDLCFDTFNKIISYAKEYDVKIAMETMGDAPVYGCCDFFGHLTEFKKAYDRICAFEDNADYFFCCIDTGHINKAMRFDNNPTPGDFIRQMGSAVKCLHLNDNNTLTDQHKPPKTGVIDWDDVLSALDEVGYNGVYNLELNLQHFGKGFEIETAEFSIKLLKYMLNK
ncbi:MAG: sugar phosphate isomerase/epimerase [Clostridia bacterium]|nr:sugar phosphate isomerase/epimerase [Clostridia bacterium]